VPEMSLVHLPGREFSGTQIRVSLNIHSTRRIFLFFFLEITN
jgi:hypothetical protein